MGGRRGATVRRPERDTAWAMSEENIELVRGVMAEFTKLQQPSEAARAGFRLGYRSRGQLGRGNAVFHGPDGFREFFAQWTHAYEEWTQDLESFIDAGDRQVVVTTVAARTPAGAATRWSRFALSRSSGRSRTDTSGVLRSTDERPKMRSKPPGCRSSCAVTPRPRSPAERVPPVYLWMGGRPWPAALRGSGLPARDTAWAMSEENVERIKAGIRGAQPR